MDPTEKIDGVAPSQIRPALVSIFPSEMSFFSNLISEFPFWASLKDHLTSVANLTVVEESRYAHIFYTETSRMDLPFTHAFRSVVWDMVRHLPVGVTPFKTTEGFPAAGTHTVIEPFVDGVPLGVFWDEVRSSWRLFTRKVLDAGNRFYSQTKTFANMATEAGLWVHLPLEPTTPYTSYTFMIQHPENRVVVPIGVAKAVCVQIVTTQPNGSLVYQSPATAYGVAPVAPAAAVFPTRTPATFYPSTRGFVYKNTITGQQWAAEDPFYTEVRALRGDSSRLDYHWMNLWAQGSLDYYLFYYPEEKEAAYSVIGEWQGIGHQLFQLYGDIFFRRTVAMGDIPLKFKTPVPALGTNVFFGLHNIFKAHRAVTGERLTYEFVQSYLNTLDVPLRLHMLNWDLREAAKATGKPFVPAARPVRVWSDVRWHLDSWIQSMTFNSSTGTPMTTPSLTV